MAYFLIVTGILLVATSFLAALRLKDGLSGENGSGISTANTELFVRLAALQREVEALKKTVAELQDELYLVPSEEELPGNAAPYGAVAEQIRQAHAAGESIESLARRFGRGKGEIALILNLKR
ncbi:hypothetical protein MHOCP_07970 [Moorella humiferrea]|uniref:DUF2802 domain-containing protein n=1 Tax=Neomoorella humiferrea TaxID=676965 RepID=A0A2T0AN07_9FIRM|nr:hypothetical protein [Moorella humiferrea]PRR70246.1 hypothetical protein MOHU_20370 [Moorella humiferrea]